LSGEYYLPQFFFSLRLHAGAAIHRFTLSQRHHHKVESKKRKTNVFLAIEFSKQD